MTTNLDLIRHVEDGGARFLCQQFDTDDPVLAIRKAVSQLFTHSAVTVPVDLISLMARRRVKICKHTLSVNREAILKPVRGGFELTLSGATPYPLLESARKFTIAHEIMETFFFSPESETPVHWSLLSGHRAGATPKALGNAGFEERLCDYGAGLILVPRFVVEDLTKGGETLPSYSELKSASRACEVAPITLTHRIACYLGVKHGVNVVVGMVKKCFNPKSDSAAEATWRFFPISSERRERPVGIDIGTTLRHSFYFPTNRSVKNLGLSQLLRWLDGGRPEDAPPIGETGQTTHKGCEMRLTVRQATFDRAENIGVLWLDLCFD